MPEEITKPKEPVALKKAEILNKLHQMITDLKIDLNEKLSVHDELAEDSRKKHEEVVTLLKEQLADIKSKSAEQVQEIEILTDKLETALKEKKEVLNQAERVNKEKLEADSLAKEVQKERDQAQEMTREAQKEKDQAQEMTREAQKERDQAIAAAEKNLEEKDKLDKKYKELQEQWSMTL